MTAQQPSAVDRDRLGAALTARGLRYAREEDVLELSFAPAKPGEPSLRVSAAVELDGAVVAFRGHLATSYSADMAPRALAAIAAVHEHRRWPTGVLIWDDEDAGTFLVAGGVHVPTLGGATDEQLLAYVDAALPSISHLATTVHRALVERQSAGFRVPTAAELESWLEE